MNKNLPHAVRVIRAALASTGSDPAAAIAHALNDVHLLVDPEKSFGAVLHRTPAGGWTSKQPQQLTELEKQALAWDQSCGRAQQAAAAIEEQIGQHPEFQSVQVDKDRVLVALHITDQAQWVQWRAWFGITLDKEQPLPYAVAGDGYRDGVRVSVVAYDLPQVRARAAQSAKRPFQLDGVVYDLALPQRDSQGSVWFFQGQRAEDGMPLLSVEGRPERCSLDKIVQFSGPLTPVKGAETPVTARGGEVA
ncbi:BN159_2729 family protein [Streptomyces olindensis]|uniref:BN159_2729 family protein n=1 Tax=Streptomyces olindensis TaxID=358823 RepID=UPI0036958A9F